MLTGFVAIIFPASALVWVLILPVSVTFHTARYLCSIIFLIVVDLEPTMGWISMQPITKVQHWMRIRTTVGLEEGSSCLPIRHPVMAFPHLLHPFKAIDLGHSAGTPLLCHDTQQDSHYQPQIRLPHLFRLPGPHFRPALEEMVFLQRNKTVQRGEIRIHPISLKYHRRYRKLN